MDFYHVQKKYKKQLLDKRMVAFKKLFHKAGEF